MQWILNRFFHMIVFSWNQKADIAAKKALQCSEINISIFLSTEELNEVVNQNVYVYAYTLEIESEDCSKKGLIWNID